jgi:hypothetical protein
MPSTPSAQSISTHAGMINVIYANFPCRMMAGRKSFGTAFAKGSGNVAAPLLASGALTTPALSNMYSAVVKMSAENKITAQNSWALPLIDHMETLLELRGGQGKQQAAGGKSDENSADSGFITSKGSSNKAGMKTAPDAALMNFQRASCALDASMKIYAARVDDTYTTSFRVLDSLSRSGKEEAERAKGEGEEGGEEEEGGEGNGKTRGKGKKQALSADPNASSTIEKNKSAITISSLETAYDIDPLYHKFASGYDENGIRGMLLNVLHVSTGCDIAFDSCETVDIDSISGAGIDLATSTLPVPEEWATLLTAAQEGSTGAKLCRSINIFYTDMDKYAAALKLSPLADVAASIAASGAKSIISAGVAAEAMYVPAHLRVSQVVVDTSVHPPTAQNGGETGVTSSEGNTQTSVTATVHAPEAVVDTSASPMQYSGDGDSDDDSSPAYNDACTFDPSAPSSSYTASTTAAGGAGDVDFEGDNGSSWDDVVGDSGAGSDAKRVSNGSRSSVGPQSNTGIDLALLSAAVSNSRKPIASAVASLTTPFKGREARHWRVKSMVSRSSDASEASGSTKTTTKKRAPAAKGKAARSKAMLSFDFTVPFAGSAEAGDVFVRAKRVAAPKSKSAAASAVPRDSEQLTPAALEKLEAGGPLQFIIPAGLWAADLEGLCLQPRHNLSTSNAAAVAQLMALATMPSLAPAACAVGHGITVDRVRGGAHHGASINTGNGSGSTYNHAGSNDMGGGDDDGDAEYGWGGGMDDGPDMSAPSNNDNASTSTGTAPVDGAAPGSGLVTTAASVINGVHPSLDGVEAAVEYVSIARKVERIRVKYDTVAKKVDVRQLKEDMWNDLSACTLAPDSHKTIENEFRKKAAVTNFEDESNISPETGLPAFSSSSIPLDGSATSFKRVVNELAPAMSDAVTIPFYFITILHLANEHDLTFRRPEGSTDVLGDFFVGKLTK